MYHVVVIISRGVLHCIVRFHREREREGGGDHFGVGPTVDQITDLNAITFITILCSCTFEGTHDELKAHLDKCKFEGLKGFLSRTDDHLEDLQEELKRKDEEIMFLRSMLASLSEKVDHMEKTAVGKIGRSWREGRRERERA